MTRDAVEAQFDTYADELRGFVLTHVSPMNVIGHRRIPVADNVLRRLAQSEIREDLDEVMDEMRAQRDVMLDYAADVANGADPAAARDTYHDRFLASNPLYNRFSDRTRYDPEVAERQDALETELLDHAQEMAVDLAPLIASEADAFYDAVRDTYDRETAEQVLDSHLNQAAMFREYADYVDLTMEMEIDALLFTKEITLDATRETIRVLEAGERYVRDRLHQELDQVYDG